MGNIEPIEQNEPLVIGVSVAKLDLYDKVESLLATLPDNPDDIASRLAQEECFGCQTSSQCCPLAIFLRRMLGLTRVSLGLSEVKACLGEESARNDLPQATQQFIWRFDRGKYPFLIAKYPPAEKIKAFPSSTACF